MPHHIKRRLLIALSAVSIIIIVILWAWYFDWSLSSPETPPPAATGTILKNGIARIIATIEEGVINSYLYIDTFFSEGRTFVIER